MRSAEARVLDAFDQGLLPDPVLQASEWATTYRKLPNGAPWDLEKTPYIRAPLDAMSVHHPCETVVLQSASQIGKTAGLIENVLGYYVDHAPRNILIVEPTVEVAQFFSRDRVEPTFEQTPCLKGKLKDRRSRDSENTVQRKVFPGGSLTIRGANAPSGLKMLAAPVLILDEVQDFPVSAGNQGDPVLLAAARQRTFLQQKTLAVSTPGVAGLSRIVTMRTRCERGLLWKEPCPRCEFAQELVYERLVYEPPKGEVPDVVPDVRYRCTQCQGEIAEREKYAMLAAGDWAIEWDRGARSLGFRLPGLCSPFPGAAWGRIVARWEKTKSNAKEHKVVVNTDLGVAFEEEHEAPDWERLYRRREFYPIGTVPPGALFLTAFADVQKDRIEVEVRGWGREKESWSVLYEVFPGDTAGDEPWDALERLRLADIPCAGGGSLPIWFMGVDSGSYSQRVYRWIRKKPQPWVNPAGIRVVQPRTVAATKGRDHWDSIVITPRRADGDRKRGLKVFLIGASAAKLELYQWLRLDPPTPEEYAAGKRYPHGFMHFPDYDAAYFQQLVAEVVELHQTQAGHDFRRFKLPPGLRNEALDCAAGNRWCAAVCGIDRFGPREWKRLEAVVPPGLLAARPAPPPVAARPADAPAVRTTPAPGGPTPAPTTPRRKRRGFQTSESPWMRR